MDCDEYIVAGGPNKLNIGSTSTDRTLTIIFEYLRTAITKKLSEEPETEIVISLYGHCVTGTEASKVIKKLKAIPDIGQKIKIRSIISDPFAGITANKSGDNPKLDLRSKKKENAQENNAQNASQDEFEGTTVLYQMGGGYFGKYSKWSRLNKIIKFTPQMILGADRILISVGHHNSYNEDYQYFLWFINHDHIDYDGNKDALVLPDRGIYIVEFDPKWKITAIEKNRGSIQNAVNKISDFTKGNDKERIKILTNIIAIYFGIKPDNFLEFLPEYESIITNVVAKIKKSLTIRGAFSYVDDLFKPTGSLFGFIRDDGKFRHVLDEAKNCVVGINNNDYKNAIKALKYEGKKPTNKKYKRAICLCLTHKS
ncbi:hypothetical protein FACS189465_3040 [Clostridia bacterium]|nr:hypothetical protein FACS189465_3040 [Clostridia bacterium]